MMFYSNLDLMRTFKREWTTFKYLSHCLNVNPGSNDKRVLLIIKYIDNQNLISDGDC